jgi:endonuclease G
MAKFRMNHSRQGKGSSGMVVRVGVFAALIAGLLFIYSMFASDFFAVETEPDAELAFLAPKGGEGEVIYHDTYLLSYSEAHELAEWVAYRLTKSELNQPWLKREDNFRPDPKVSTRSADPADYRRSGYDRGHLLPVADRAYSRAAMDETFYMSNISPQARHFNGGVWRELEELTRDWAKEAGQLYVVTGPVLEMTPKGTIGNNQVTVPAAYYKVLLDLEEPQLRGIGFIIPNTVTYEPLRTFAASIDEVEQLTGLDFFAEFMPEEVEQEIEANADTGRWRFSESKYRKRIEHWNKQ